jgi:hypothetical protein
MTRKSISFPKDSVLVQKIEAKANGDDEDEDDDGPYASEAAYVRAMMTAGMSQVAALDPRTASPNTSASPDLAEVEDAVSHIGTELLLDELSSDPQQIEDVLQRPTQEWQSALANHLDELARDDDSPVDHDPMNGYYLTNK